MEITIEKQSDGSYIAYNTTGNKVTLIGTGDTVKEAKEDFYNSLEEVRSVYDPDQTPDELNEEINFHFDLSSLFEYYSVLNVSAFARFVGINESLMRQYKKGDTYISDKQLEKIENGIHQIGEEFTQLKLI
jgi:hypothetical protein